MGYTRALRFNNPQMYGNDIKEVQTKLNSLGYSCGTVDGYFGPKTDAAVRGFQSRNNLAIDGSVGPATWSRLFGGSTQYNSYTSALFYKNPQMYGDIIKTVQYRLNALGFSCGSVDGYFGPKTDSAVKRFQITNGLQPDGSVGPATWGKLFNNNVNVNNGIDSGKLTPQDYRNRGYSVFENSTLGPMSNVSFAFKKDSAIALCLYQGNALDVCTSVSGARSTANDLKNLYS